MITGLHHLRCEIGRWTIPKEEWEKRTCLFCSKGVVETEWHFIMECAAYSDIHIKYGDNLKVDVMKIFHSFIQMPNNHEK